MRAPGPVAQRLEPTAHNGLVAGSSPAGPTNAPSPPRGRGAEGEAVLSNPTTLEKTSMPYTLQRLAAGSYDLLLDGAVVGSVVREVANSGHVRGWRAELMSGEPPLPAPFTQETHEFKSFEATVSWLGGSLLVEGG